MRLNIAKLWTIGGIAVSVGLIVWLIAALAMPTDDLQAAGPDLGPAFAGYTRSTTASYTRINNWPRSTTTTVSATTAPSTTTTTTVSATTAPSTTTTTTVSTKTAPTTMTSTTTTDTTTPFNNQNSLIVMAGYTRTTSASYTRINNWPTSSMTLNPQGNDLESLIISAGYTRSTTASYTRINNWPNSTTTVVPCNVQIACSDVANNANVVATYSRSTTASTTRVNNWPTTTTTNTTSFNPCFILPFFCSTDTSK